MACTIGSIPPALHNMTTLQIKYCDIPSYLHAGEFYRSLNSDDPDGIIEIPADCFHQDGITAADVEEFRQLLRVMVFWMLEEIPVGILHFCNTQSVEEWEQSIAALPDVLKQTVQTLLLSVFTKSEYVLFKDIVKTGRWDLIMYAVSQMGNQASVTFAAARCGHLRLLQHLHENGFEWDEETCSAASREGHLDCLQFAHENGCPWNEKVFKGAAQNGHLNCMQYAHRQGLRKWHTDVCKYAALGGHLDCLQFAHENSCPWGKSVYYGHLNCMQYAHQQGLEWHEGVCRHAARNGRLSCLQYAHDNGCPWGRDTTYYAAEKGHLDCLLYALEHGCPTDEGTYELACRSGHVEYLQLLHQYGVPWDTYAACVAAGSPTIGCLQYLREHDCPWDEGTPHHAALDGNIEPLRYALEHGCPHDDRIVKNTAHGNNLDCLQFVVGDQGLTMDEEVFKVALLEGDLANLNYLLDQGCPYLDASFGDDAKLLSDKKYVCRIDHSEFILCVEFAVERGWVPCKQFIQFVEMRDKPCKDWLIKEGFYAEKTTAAFSGWSGITINNSNLYLNCMIPIYFFMRCNYAH